jgi:Protein of unknown function (DUF1569)
MVAERRNLTFDAYDQVIADVDNLVRNGYDKAGQWDLGQTCDHLAFFMEGSLSGPNFKTPWVLRVLFGRLVLRRILTSGRMKAGVPTPQKPLPAPGRDERAAVAKLEQTIGRLKTHTGELHASPFFGYLTPEQWQRLHLTHCAHHLGFLIPRSASC